MKKAIRVFEVTAAALLLLTALAKFVSSTGNSMILRDPDPVFNITYKQEFIIVGLIELVIARICLFSKRPWLRAGSIAWLATHFMLYRGALLWMGVLKPCPCMGTLTEMLPIDQATLDKVLIGILGYMLVGSYATLLWLFLQRSKKAQPAGPMPSVESATPAA